MKKILSIIVVLVALTGIANAQITIKKSAVGRPVQVATLSQAWSWLYKVDDMYFIGMKSDNQFETWFWMSLGKTKDECLESLSSLLELCDTITDEDAYDIDNGIGEKLSVTKYKAMGMNGLKFRDDSHVGFGYILPANLTKAQKWIQKNLE